MRRDSGSLPTSSRSAEQTQLLAAAGLDLFRAGLFIDGAGTKPVRVEPRHPAVSPNLSSIPEGDFLIDSSRSTQAQVIVVVGGPLKAANLPGPWLAHRIEAAVPLYQSIADHRRGVKCYVVPFGGDGPDDGVLECEVIRNHLVQRGVSPHHILMDCSATNPIQNVMTLVPVLRHLQVAIVRVVTSAFQMPRMQLYFDSVLHRCHDMAFEVYYHPAAAPPLSFRQQQEQEAIEEALVTRTRRQLDDAMQVVSAASPYLAQLHEQTMPPPVSSIVPPPNHRSTRGVPPTMTSFYG